MFSPEGIIGALSATDYKDPPKVCVYEIKDRTCKSYALNPMPDGTCRTIKNQYYKNSVSNFRSGGTFGASGVLVVYGS